MKGYLDNVDTVERNLKDAGCDETLVKEFIKLIKTGERKRQLRICLLYTSDLAEKAEVVIYCLGLNELGEAEGLDRSHMRIPQNQIDLLETLAKVLSRIHIVFRGTIDFKFGAAGAEGEEKEDVLLLGDDVINQTIPLILCAEEDVQGNHCLLYTSRCV